VSRFEQGDLSTLAEVARRAPLLTPEFRIAVVQPGLSKRQAGVAQLDLLGATELYLHETFEIAFDVIASA